MHACCALLLVHAVTSSLATTTSGSTSAHPISSCDDDGILYPIPCSSHLLLLTVVEYVYLMMQCTHHAHGMYHAAYLLVVYMCLCMHTDTTTTS